MRWKILNNLIVEDVINVLLENRGLINKLDKEEFFNPRHPKQLTLKELGINHEEVEKAAKRLQEAKKNDEEILIYGDYDADGVSATAVLWEVLHSSGFKVQPYIPDRFSDGYGINAETIKNLKLTNKNLSLIVTVDNGVVASKPISEINNLGIDVIVTDHHQQADNTPPAMAIVHTDKISGSAVSWVFANELYKSGIVSSAPSLDMVAIGTVADVLPLLGPNRSFVKHGLKELNQAKRPGISQLCIQAGINADQIGCYEIAFVIAPRLNSMGRLKHALDSLRLVCTKNLASAQKIAQEVSLTNEERQKVVEEVVSHAQLAAMSTTNKLIVLAHESYHEGVIGLAAAKLVERYYRPAIVISKGETVAKASARSIDGFNIIEHIRKVQHLIIEGGGHTQAAGFSIEVSKIEEFIKALNEEAAAALTDAVLEKSLTVDMKVDFSQLNWDLMTKLKDFEPTGNGNRQPIFVTESIEVLSIKPVGQEGKHLKLLLQQNGKKFDAIGFGLGKYASTLTKGSKIDAAFSLEENTWNGNTVLQLKLKDIHTDNEQ